MGFTVVPLRGQVMGFTVVPSPAPLVDETVIFKLDSVKMAVCSACLQRSY